MKAFFLSIWLALTGTENKTEKIEDDLRDAPAPINVEIPKEYELMRTMWTKPWWGLEK